MKDAAACPPAVRARLLGGFELQVDHLTITDELNRSLKMWNFLAYIVVHRSRNIPQSEFIEALWPSEDNVNPVNALKTLLYRIRNTLSPILGTNCQLIVSQRGSYSWNRALPCATDAEEFEALCRQAENTDLPAQERLALYEKAQSLYRGDFLPKLSDQLWVVPLATHYHTLYLNMAKSYADLLQQNQLYERMAEVCNRAISIDSLDEQLHTRLILALLRQGKDMAALSHYEKATDLLYRNLGVRPSEQLRALYTEIMKVSKSLETDLGVVQEQLKETASRPGAFVCAYGFFREAYRLAVRRAQRDGACIHICLLTISQPDGSVPPLDQLNETMDQLLDLLQHCLRRGDVVSRYSGAQFVLMLPTTNFEDGTLVMERIVSEFKRRHRHNFLKIHYKLQQLDLE